MKDLKIVTYNTGHGKFNKYYFKGLKVPRKSIISNIKAQINLLSELDADIILTQEIAKNAYINQYKKSLNNYHSKYCSNTNILNIYNIGNSTFSKYEFSYIKHIIVPFKLNSFKENLSYLNKSAILTENIIDNKKLIVINIHLIAYEKNKKLREKQIGYIFEFALKEYSMGNYVIVGGDFNHQFNKEKSIIDSYKVFGWQHAVPNKNTLRNNKKPFNKQSETYKVDGFIVSPNITIKKVNSLFNFDYSDHSPVIMTFSLNNK